MRGGKLPEAAENSRKQRVEPVAVTLPSGKLNAVRAAFKAGPKPSQIARQFGIFKPMFEKRWHRWFESVIATAMETNDVRRCHA
jgi:hypothetical protein